MLPNNTIKVYNDLNDINTIYKAITGRLTNRDIKFQLVTTLIEVFVPEHNGRDYITAGVNLYDNLSEYSYRNYCYR